MKSILLGIVALVILAGCGPRLNVKLDDAVAKELPKEIAVKYLKKVSRLSHQPFDDETYPLCTFSENYIGRTNAGKYRSVSKGMYSSGTVNVFRFDRFVSIRMYFKVEFRESKTFFCYLTLDNEEKGLTGTVKERTQKTATALKSLGVKVESK